MGRNRYKIVEPSSPHFVTCTILRWIPVFTCPETVNILIDSLRFLKTEGMKVYAYVILENHIHLVVQSSDLCRDLARFKSYTARQLLDYLSDRNATQILKQLSFYKKAHKRDRKYQFWQEGYHPELIQNDAMMRQKIEYIHQNPVKSGYVEQAEHWRYSSAQNYAGLDGLFEVDKVW